MWKPTSRNPLFSCLKWRSGGSFGPKTIHFSFVFFVFLQRRFALLQKWILVLFSYAKLHFFGKVETDLSQPFVFLSQIEVRRVIWSKIIDFSFVFLVFLQRRFASLQRWILDLFSYAKIQFWKVETDLSQPFVFLSQMEVKTHFWPKKPPFELCFPMVSEWRFCTPAKVK